MEYIRDYFENLCFNKFENLEEMDGLLDTYGHPKLNEENINHLKRSITKNEIEARITLIPKLDRHLQKENYRPTSLMNNDENIFNKILAN
jgi:hypothetical protein